MNNERMLRVLSSKTAPEKKCWSCLQQMFADGRFRVGPSPFVVTLAWPAQRGEPVCVEERAKPYEQLLEKRSRRGAGSVNFAWCL